MDKCRDPERWGPVSRLRDFDLTPCFEEGVLLSSFLVLLFLALFRSWSLRSVPQRERSDLSIWFLRLKLILLLSIFALSLSPSIFGPRLRPAVSEFYVLEPITFLAASILTYWNHTRTRRSSTILLLFWPPYIISTAIWTRTQVALAGDFPWHLLSFSSRVSIAVIGFSSLLLECITPEIGPAIRLPEDSNADLVENPILNANFYSRMTFGWMAPLMKLGSSKFIVEDDLPPLLSKDKSEKLGNDLERARAKFKSLRIALFAAYGGPFAIAIALKLIQDCLAFLQPQLLRLLLSFISDYQSRRKNLQYGGELPSSAQGFAIAFAMFAASVVQTSVLHQYFQRCFETGMRVRAGMVTAVYKKALLLSNAARKQGTGDIVNLMSVDATRLQDLCTYGLIAISGPFQITLAFVSLYNLLGWSAFVGVAIMIFSVPLNTAIARYMKRLQEQQMKNRDKRTRLMSELLNNIRSIKLYAWETAFMKKILHVRNNQELKMLKKIGIATSLNMSLWIGIPLLVAFSSFAVAALVSSRPLTPEIIFPAMSLFMLLQFPLAMLAQVTSSIIEAWVSVNRLSDYLNAEELEPDARTVHSEPQNDVVLSIKDGEFYWSKLQSPALQGINLTVKKGDLVGVLGRVGSGKSSLLSAIIGEMVRGEGQVTVSGSVAYAPSTPWIMSATVRDNILFSHQYDESFYNLVLDACALRPDLELLTDGDLTEVGEKGITLSGGQRARISLARVVYARADLVLLDDVLAAVDAHVARHVFDQVVGPNGLLADKARILVTNTIHFLPQHDSLIYLRNGLISESGCYDDLMNEPNSELRVLITDHGNGRSRSGASTPHGNATFNPKLVDAAVESLAIARQSSENEKNTSSISRKDYGKAVVADLTRSKSSNGGITKEHSEQGSVKRDVYKQYIQAASISGFVFFIVASICQQGTSIMATVVLRVWGEHNREVGSNAGMGKFVLAYGLFSLTSVLLGAVSSIVMWVFISLRSARRLHDSMLNAVLRAPLSFFESTPTGRILNLFSKDVYVVDQVLARVVQGLIRTVCTCLGILLVIGVGFPPFLIAVIPLSWFYRRVMIYYLSTSRELKRLDAVSRSPIFAWFSESLGGLSTIRAFNQQTIFTRQNEHRLDRNQICYLPSILVNRWLAVRLELVGASIILLAALLAVYTLITTGIDAGLVGLVLSYGLNTTGSLNWVVRTASEVEQNIVSVERILHYVRLGPEAPDEIPDKKPTPPWPRDGAIEFKDYSMRYRPDLDLVLKKIDLSIKPREKIGICGRTGAGKSSLLLGLFRICEPASGSILVDGVDIMTLGLRDLRSSVSIVPQQPDLFEGTMRENIDPTGQYHDLDIWTALDQAHLKEFVYNLPGKLDAPVREGGSSMSSGQRQLLCFARALLRKSKILVLDEATSAVDLETDKSIQDIIRGPLFTDVTMLTIAHRLNTIMESDRVLVLDQGMVAEFDSPENLLNKKDSIFYSLAVEAGLA